MNVLAAKTHWQRVTDCGWGRPGVSTRRDPIREQSACKEGINGLRALMCLDPIKVEVTRVSQFDL